MCGIVGIYALNEKGQNFFDRLRPAMDCLQSRGPDAEGAFFHGNIALGHKRLSIIDTSDAGLQPMSDNTGRYTIIYNGEFFNFKEYKSYLLNKGYSFKSESDTEVLLALYITEGAECLNKINGFFSLAIYDKLNDSLFLARDRYGVKPLLIYKDEDKILFASEMKALLAMRISKAIDQESLFSYFQLNYIPGDASIFRDVKKVKPGYYIEIKEKSIKESCYYSIPLPAEVNQKISFSEAKDKIENLLTESVKRRLIADVPLGAFLSGGIDSSIITGIASRHTRYLKTFSIGYKDEPAFDETQYAMIAAKKFKTDHTVFSLSNTELFTHLYDVLDYIDEPFADSSIIPGFILSKKTAGQLRVALSGDGADELFGGYNKHRAEYVITRQKINANIIKAGGKILELLPKSRNSAFGNKIRQLLRFSEGAGLGRRDRYWLWCSIAKEKNVKKLLLSSINQDEYNSRRENILRNIDEKSKDLNEILYTDLSLVLPDDMLRKVDAMSMANSLEVRNPFLDYELVNFVSSLPSSFKINSTQQKWILKEAFKELLPGEIFLRGKKGFEVPLLKWFRTELFDYIFNDLLEKDFVNEQRIFNYAEIEKLRRELMSPSPGDSPSIIWALIVFQYWWKKNMMS